MKKRHGAEQIVGFLRQADVALGKGEVASVKLRTIDFGLVLIW